MDIRKVGITSKPHKADIEPTLVALVSWLRARNIEVLLDEETATAVQTAIPRLASPEIVALADLLIVLGGDGTLLATARAISDRAVPILAVNLGGLGFLTVTTLDELYPALEMVLAGKYHSETRVRLQAEVVRGGETGSSHLALNDAVLNKGAIARVLDFDVSVDGRFMSTYKSDGLIVATPTGSTAYSLAAGGPVIVPQVNAFIVTPICAHTLTNRPIVLPDSVTLEVAMGDHQESVYLTVDGQVAVGLRSDDRVRIRKAPHCIQLIRPPHKTYFDILRQKLKWGER
ncbi:MAG: NAD(+)/NADH kinase [Terriglobia bacterium]